MIWRKLSKKRSGKFFDHFPQTSLTNVEKIVNNNALADKRIRQFIFIKSQFWIPSFVVNFSFQKNPEEAK